MDSSPRTTTNPIKPFNLLAKDLIYWQAFVDRAPDGSKRMPAKPWTTFYQPDDDREYLVLLTELPLRRFRDLSGFMGHTFRIISQLKSTSGVLGYSFLGRFFQRRFWTLSVWEDEAALKAFVRQTPHLTAMKAMQGKMAKTRFIRWRIRGSEYPPIWSEVLSRQPEP